jgi:hypothetical protein
MEKRKEWIIKVNRGPHWDRIQLKENPLVWDGSRIPIWTPDKFLWC